MKYYHVFKAGTNGGKRFAVVHEPLPESVMSEIAVSSSAPITAFIINPVGANLLDPKAAPDGLGSLVFAQSANANSQSRTMTSIAPTKNIVQVRFFTNQGKEKLESDSGALVVAHHFGQSCTVQMQAGNLEVMLEDGYVWAAQPDTHILPCPSDSKIWLEALNLRSSDLETDLTVLCAGTLDKHNFINENYFLKISSAVMFGYRRNPQWKFKMHEKRLDL